MGFCDTKCLLCDKNGVRTINHSGYHKICQDHLNRINDFIQTYCKHCNSKVQILREYLFCKCCNKKKCQAKPNSISNTEIKPKINSEIEVETSSNQKKLICKNADISYQNAPEESLCKKCHFITEKQACLECKATFCSKCNPFEKYCSNCLNSISDCDNCGKVGMSTNLKCSHLGCHNCKDQNFCKKCDFSQFETCNNCKKPYQIKRERKNQQDVYDECINDLCRECYSNLNNELR